MEGSGHISDILVSVSDNTLETERFLKERGVKTIRTSGKSFMDDLHDSFSHLDGDFVLTCPSDVPLLSSKELDKFIESFDVDIMQSHVALVEADVVRDLGIEPSFTMEMYGRHWAVSGLSIMDRKKTLAGDYLKDSYYCTDCKEFAVNVNTQEDLRTAKGLF